MYKRKTVKFVALLLTLCLLLTAFPGSAISVRAEGLGVHALDNANVTSASSDFQQWALINLYDAETFTGKTGYIDTAISFADTFYTELKSISICRYGNISVDTVTDLSDCPAGVDIPCREALGCGTNLAHHKDIRNVMDDLFDWRQINEYSFLPYYREIVVLWSHLDGTYCEYVDGQHFYPGYCAVSRANECTITIMDPMAWTTNSYTAHLSFLLTHELVHHMGYNDVYDTENHKDDGRYSCLMDYFELPELSASTAYQLYLEWLEHPEDAFCSTCKINLRIN